MGGAPGTILACAEGLAPSSRSGAAFQKHIRHEPN